MATVFVPSYELGADGTSLYCRLVFSGADLQANPTGANVTVTGIDFVNDNPTQIQTKTVPANGVILPALAKG